MDTYTDRITTFIKLVQVETSILFRQLSSSYNSRGILDRCAVQCLSNTRATRNSIFTPTCISTCKLCICEAQQVLKC